MAIAASLWFDDGLEAAIRVVYLQPGITEGLLRLRGLVPRRGGITPRPLGRAA